MLLTAFLPVDGLVLLDAEACTGAVENDSWIINLLIPGIYENHFKSMIFKLIIETSSLGIRCEIRFGWMFQIHTNKSTLVQVITWCRQATSHYLNQCWRRSMSSYSVTRPQRISTLQRSRHVWRVRALGTRVDTSRSLIWQITLKTNIWY